MSNILQEITSELPSVYENAKFNSQNLIGMLQGLVGFTAAGAAKDPFALIDQTLAFAEESSQRCHLKSLDSFLGSIKQWLTIGKHYKPLVDSSELDFDQMNVSSVPQIMQVYMSRCNVLRQYTGFNNYGPLMRTNSYIEHAWIETESWGLFLEFPLAFRARKAMPYFVQDQSFNTFDNDEIKISVQ